MELSSDQADARQVLEALAQSGQKHEVVHAGCRIVWRSFGQGPRLVLFHGGHGSWLHWARNIEVLSQRYQLWLPDLPGYGDSDALSDPSMHALVDATLASMASLLGADDVIPVVGFSFGGLLSAHVAARRAGPTPLALLGPGGHGGPRRPIGDLRAWRQAAQGQDWQALGEIMRHNLLMHMVHEPQAIDEMAVQIHSVSCQRTRFASKPISHAGGLAKLLEDHHAPLLLAWGACDVTADPQWAARALSANHTSCQTHIVPGAGHWVQYEAAQAVNHLLLDWLDAVTAHQGRI